MVKPKQVRHISGDDVKLIIVRKPPKDEGPGYSDQEVEDVLNRPIGKDGPITMEATGA